MTSRPRIICHMTSSIDGGLHPSRYTTSPDGAVEDWSAAYEAVHDALGGDGWIVGRVTMAEMAKGEPHPPAAGEAIARPVHDARKGAASLAIAFDPTGRLHFAAPDIDGDNIVVLLGGSVEDRHLAELASDGISYIVSKTATIDLEAALTMLAERFGVQTLLLEGGGTINGAFFAAGLVDEFSVVVAPALDGAADAERIVGTPGGLHGKIALSLIGCEQLEGGAVHLRYAVRPG